MVKCDVARGNTCRTVKVALAIPALTSSTSLVTWGLEFHQPQKAQCTEKRQYRADHRVHSTARSVSTAMEQAKEITATNDWKTESDPRQAGWLFVQELLQNNKDSKTLCLTLDIRDDKESQDRALVSFYRRDYIQWASPLECKLQGDIATGSGVQRHLMSMVIFRLTSGFHVNLGSAAITKLFEGEPDHLIPSISDGLLDNNMFAMAGRIIGHSFLHHGPSFPGLSQAIIHTLFGGSLETTPITVQDCPDLDVRDIVTMLSEDDEINNLDTINQLCVQWNLPTPNDANRKWLSDKLLFHAVIERTRDQINQFQRGLQDTGLWPLLIHRREIIPILFPREAETQVTSQMLLDCITWPCSTTVIFEEYEAVHFDERDLEDTSRVSSFLKNFIETESSDELKSLIRFWIGWEVPAAEMKVEIVEAVGVALAAPKLTCTEKGGNQK
ncbi:uncharacterized protein LOC109528382 isoform X3 [Hippocampus comes]|uniref:uncharacterized protein LOC109528382 isoform X3 n=1 Tax=Hippocampus comes TaxID=109280 RepID=UPI00094EADD4|nr:PREDICTED: uncharacterized protein LOC109528382 isoform X3 [Hippocampus comes]